jgi:hypothetical protein
VRPCSVWPDLSPVYWPCGSAFNEEAIVVHPLEHKAGQKAQVLWADNFAAVRIYVQAFRMGVRPVRFTAAIAKMAPPGVTMRADRTFHKNPSQALESTFFC